MRAFLTKNLEIGKTNLYKNEECFIDGIEWGDSFDGFKYLVSVEKKGRFLVEAGNLDIPKSTLTN